VNLILFQTIKQTLKVARRLSEETKPAAVYSSGLTRAAETAQLIAGACGVPDSDVSTLTLEQINLNFTISICYFFFLAAWKRTCSICCPNERGLLFVSAGD
jgi:hypothetical protein